MQGVITVKEFFFCIGHELSPPPFSLMAGTRFACYAAFYIVKKKIKFFFYMFDLTVH